MLYNFILLKLLQGKRDGFLAPSQKGASKILRPYRSLGYSSFAKKNMLCREIFFFLNIYILEKGYKTLLVLYFLPSTAESQGSRVLQTKRAVVKGRKEGNKPLGKRGDLRERFQSSLPVQVLP